MSRSISQLLIKYRIAYLLGWIGVAFFTMLITYDPRAPLLPQWIGHMIVTGAAFPVCYYLGHTIVPRYLYRKKIGLFISYLLLLAILNSIVTYLLALFVYHVLTGLPVFRSATYIFTVFIGVVFVDVILLSVACIIKIIGDRYFMEQQMLEIEKEKVITELNFLRSQVNPHFLFNIMNTIYFQIEKKNTEARLSVEKFSEMLRYQLYECITDKIQIQKELHYIRNYVAIQTLRMEKESDILLSIEQDMDDFLIAPLLILPIVENAFKHVSNFKEPVKNKIHLIIKNQGNMLLVETINTYDQLNGQKQLLDSGGLGIQNLKRRLELLYPNRHELNINKQSDTFQTLLRLQYSD
jgi:sensor histidine kinase YesM